MPPQHFAARWSRSVWIVTLAVSVLVVSIAGGMISTAIASTRGVQWLLVAGSVLVSGILWVTVLFAPVRYEILRSGIGVRRVAGRIVIPYAQVGEIRRIACRDVGFAVRVCGSGGLFGWFGRFYGSRIGWFWAYCSSQDNLVLITRTDGAKILISPYPPDVFIDAVCMAGQHTI